MCQDQEEAAQPRTLTAREAAIQIEGMHGWQPTKDRACMDSISEKVRWDMVGMIESIILRVVG